MSASFTISNSRRSSFTVPNRGASPSAEVTEFGGPADKDGVVAERQWMWMIGAEACAATVMASTGSSTTRIARAFSCSMLRIGGVFRRVLMLSEAETAGSGGTAAEKTDEVSWVRWGSITWTIREAAQKPAD